MFGSAPRELARRISLYQTVELVRTTIDVVESQIDEVMPKADRPILHAAIVQYSREVAFSAAEIYARAAELRGAWDERLEALVVDAVLRGETDETVLSRASTLGWHSTATVVVVVGGAPEPDPAQALESIRHTAAIAGIDMLGAVQGDRMIVVLGGAGLASAAWTRAGGRPVRPPLRPRSGDHRSAGRPPDGSRRQHPRGPVGLPRGRRLAGGAATGDLGRPAARAGPVRRRARPAGAGPRALRPAAAPPAAGCWRPW